MTRYYLGTPTSSGSPEPEPSPPIGASTVNQPSTYIDAGVRRPSGQSSFVISKYEKQNYFQEPQVVWGVPEHIQRVPSPITKDFTPIWTENFGPAVQKKEQLERQKVLSRKRADEAANIVRSQEHSKLAQQEKLKLVVEAAHKPEIKKYVQQTDVIIQKEAVKQFGVQDSAQKREFIQKQTVLRDEGITKKFANFVDMISSQAQKAITGSALMQAGQARIEKQYGNR